MPVRLLDPGLMAEVQLRRRWRPDLKWMRYCRDGRTVDSGA